MSNWESLKISDGTSMKLFVARPKQKSKSPAIIILQEAFGVNNHIQDVCQRFADLGFVAVSPDLFHRLGEGMQIPYDQLPKAMELVGQLTDDGQEKDLRATFDFLKNDSGVDINKVASSGYCMGGRSAFLASTILPLKAAISYYGGRIPPLLPRAADVRCSLLFFWGGKDKHIGKDQNLAVSDALTKAGKPFIEVVFSEADHAFFCDQRGSYHKKSAKISWDMVQSFLKEENCFPAV